MIKYKLVEYQFLYEDLKRVKKDYEEGSDDLNYRLSFFKKKVNDTKNDDLIVRFDSIFSKYTPPSSSKEIEVAKDIEDKDAPEDSKPGRSQPGWAKKIYKKIIMMTHPDKTSGIGIPHLVKMLDENYRVTVESFESGNYIDMLMIANSMNLELDTVPKEFQSEVDSEVKIKKTEISNIIGSLGYQWHHIKEENKDKYFKSILNQMGFVYTNEEIETVIKKERPVNDSRKNTDRPKKGIYNRKNKKG